MANEPSTPTILHGSGNPGLLDSTHRRQTCRRMGTGIWTPCRMVGTTGKLPGATTNDRLTAAPLVSPHFTNNLPTIPISIPIKSHGDRNYIEPPNSTCCSVQTQTSPSPDICSINTTDNVITDIYSLCVTGQLTMSKASTPFLMVTSLQGPQEEWVCFLATIDNGAMINAFDATMYQNTANRLMKLSPSQRTLRMADGSLVPSLGVWSGTFKWGLICCTTIFKVFPSGGLWKMLIVKTLLEQLNAIQNYRMDSIIITAGNATDTIYNATYISNNTTALPSISSLRAQSSHYTHAPSLYIQPTIQPKSTPYNTIGLVDLEKLTQHDGEVPSCKSHESDNNIFTRLKEEGPFHQPHIQKILDSVSIGPLTGEEHEKVHSLIAKFADIFTLSVWEVKPVDFIKFRLNIPKDKEYPMKVNQRPLTQIQREWYCPVLDDFVTAGVLREIRSNEVKAAHPMVLAQKAHGTPRLTINKIKRIVEDKCIRLGQKPNPAMPPRPPTCEPITTTATSPKQKWRVTQNFHSINQALTMAPMVQGDIHAKQQ